MVCITMDELQKAASLMGQKGGKARASKLSIERRKEIARKGGYVKAIKAKMRAEGYPQQSA